MPSAVLFMQSNGLFWLLEHKSFGGASWGFARLHRSFRLMFADGQSSVISSAGPRAGLGAQLQMPAVAAGFSLSSAVTSAGGSEWCWESRTGWQCRNLGLGSRSDLCEIPTIHSSRQTGVNGKVFARRALRN